jgi:DNA-binding transcriptional LysR family regulator
MLGIIFADGRASLLRQDRLTTKLCRRSFHAPIPVPAMTGAAPVELRALAIFLEVATSRSMTLSARRLGLTQPAVSQAVQRLEQSFGVALLLRPSRPVALTAAGAVLAQRAAALLHEAAALGQAVLQAGRGPAQELRLGLVDSFASTAGPGLIRALTGDAARVVVWAGLAPGLGAALVGRELDAIITSDPLEDLDGLHRFPLWREPFVLLMPADAAPPPASLAALAAERPMVRYSARSHTGQQIERHLRRVGCNAERRIEVDGSDALVAMVAEGVGWALATPLCLLQGAARAAGVRALPLPLPGFSRSLSLVCRADGPTALAARAAAAARHTLHHDCLPRLRAVSPALADSITLPPETAP